MPTVVSSWRVATPFNGGKSCVFVVDELWTSPGNLVGTLCWFVFWGEKRVGGMFVFCDGGGVLIVAGALFHTASDESVLRKLRLLSTAGVGIYISVGRAGSFSLCVSMPRL